MNNKYPKNRSIVTGLHILGEIYTKDIQNLKALSKVKKKISRIIEWQGLTELGSFYHQFPKGGFTGIVSLVESHIAIHTWPELNYLTLDVYICNYSKDNGNICRDVFDEISRIFGPLRITKKLIQR